MKRLFFSLFFFSILAMPLFTQNKTLICENLKISVSKTTGSFILYAKDNKKSWVKMLSEKGPPSSYFLFLQDGISIGYGSGDTGIYTCKIIGKEIKYAWENSDVQIICTFGFSQSQPDFSYDTFDIRLNICNLSGSDVTMSPLVCFDNNNEAPSTHYFLSGKSIFNEQEIPGAFLQDFIIMNTTVPNMNLKLLSPQQEIIDAQNAVQKFSPERIFFTNWRRMKNNTSGKFLIKPGRAFNTPPYSENDSAMFIEYPRISIPVASNMEFLFQLQIDNNIYSSDDFSKLQELYLLLKEINLKLESGEKADKEYLNNFDMRLETVKSLQ